MKNWKGVLAILLMSVLSLGFSLSAFAAETDALQLKSKSAVLMDAGTGTILYEKNSHEAMPPASVTKVMTLLLIYEAEAAGQFEWEEAVQVSEHAASMGGSQVFLESGETQTAAELTKCIAIASANDAAVAMAEFVAGSEEAFVERMNQRAAELGMANTHFENVTGLDDDTVAHKTSAMDIAIMSRELLQHPKILEYSGIWMDTIRNGAFGLTNTNRLIRFYDGATGLKTGSTSKAKFCISATAKRDNLHLIAVIMGAPTRDIRNETAKTLLDWGFANYSLYENEGGGVGEASVIGGVQDACPGEIAPFSLLMAKGKHKNVTTEILLDENIPAPIHKGEKIGSVRYLENGEILAEESILAAQDVDKIGFFGLFCRMLSIYLLK